MNQPERLKIKQLASEIIWRENVIECLTDTHDSFATRLGDAVQRMPDAEINWLIALLKDKYRKELIEMSAKV